MSSSLAGKAIFVTGTDTGVGKTMVTCALAAALAERGLRVGVYKPVETGCSRGASGLEADDTRRLLQAAGSGQPPASASTYLFELPAAPMIAAEAAGTSIEPLRLVAGFERVAVTHDVVLVEGAGGLLVPIADNFTYLDFARQLGLPVLCVVGSRLGCINHALLTLRMLLYAGVRCVGRVLNTLEPGEAARTAAETHRRAIARFSACSDGGVFPFVEENKRESREQLAALAREHLALDTIASSV